jgi:hypothetical protein
LPNRQHLIAGLLYHVFPRIFPEAGSQRWTRQIEHQDKPLLGECGKGEPTNIDVFLESKKYVICIESKFLSDARKGFKGCSAKRDRACHGFYGPGSNLKQNDSSWCILENWDGARSPRLYRSVGKAFLEPKVFRQQARGAMCHLAGSNYQPMRNLLFAAAYARKKRKDFGVFLVCPEATEAVVRQQWEAFRNDIVLQPFRSRVGFCRYENYISLLNNRPEPEAQRLGGFLAERIQALI